VAAAIAPEARAARIRVNVALPAEVSPGAPPAGPIADLAAVWLEAGRFDRLPDIARYPVAVQVAVPKTDAERDALSALLRDRGNIRSLVFELDGPDRAAFEIKSALALARGLRPDVALALDVTTGDRIAAVGPLLVDETLAASLDGLLVRPDAADPAELEKASPRLEEWLIASGTDIAAALAEGVRRRSSALFLTSSEFSRDFSVASRLQAILTEAVSGSAEPARIRFEATGQSVPGSASLYDARTLSPVVVIGGSSSPDAKADLEIPEPGAYREARVENLAAGKSRVFPLSEDVQELDLSVSNGPLAVRLIPGRPAAEQVEEKVEVGGERGLTAEEIIARERAWKAAQDDRVRTYTADLDTSLRFHIAEVNETFDLTISGPLFKQRGREFDWAWHEFHVNGVRWKGETLPKIPILQPEKVTTLPLEIELTEAYDYTLAGRGEAQGRSAWVIDFAPKPSIGDKPVYRGRAWIDSKSFALLKRRSVQLNLKGETLSNIETEYYSPVPGHRDVWLPLRIRGEEVFSTAGRTTAIERSVRMTDVEINPPDFQKRRDEQYASKKQIVRDTPRGLKYLVPDPGHPGGRIVEEYVSKKSLFGAAGFFYDGSLDYPIPLLGIQYFNFDLWRKGKQISVFFGGVILTTNFTDPEFLGTRFDVGADIFAVAIPFGDTAYRNGSEIRSERLKHIPAVFQLNVGHPLGPYLKGTVSLFTKYDNYQRDPDTASDFVTPADTETFGVEGKLTANFEGYNATLDYSRLHRSSWPFWGVPGASEYTPDQRDADKYLASLAKDYYFPGFRKFHAKVSYLGGSGLDRFSRYEFGSFSPNPMRGFNSGSLRASRAWVLNLSYGLNIEDIIRLEVLYDQALVTDPVAGFQRRYFSGVGISGQLNGPWENSLIRFDIGTPVVSHGVHGFSISALLLKLF